MTIKKGILTLAILSLGLLANVSSVSAETQEEQTIYIGEVEYVDEEAVQPISVPEVEGQEGYQGIEAISSELIDFEDLDLEELETGSDEETVEGITAISGNLERETRVLQTNGGFLGISVLVATLAVILVAVGRAKRKA